MLQQDSSEKCLWARMLGVLGTETSMGLVGAAPQAVPLGCKEQSCRCTMGTRVLLREAGSGKQEAGAPARPQLDMLIFCTTYGYQERLGKRMFEYFLSMGMSFWYVGIL